MSIDDIKSGLDKLLGRTGSTTGKAVQNQKQTPPAQKSSGDVQAFLSQVSRLPPVNTQGQKGRLVFALDATASREDTWDQAMQLQAEMFTSAQSLGGLQVQLAYFRGYAEFRASDWMLDSSHLLSLMTGIRCEAGTTKIERLLAHVLKETRQNKVHAVVYIGDCMEESMDVLCQKAGELGILNVPLFMFQEGNDPVAQRCFKEMARLSGGAWAPFDHRSADQLRDLLKAVAIYASGGLKALQDFSRTAHPDVRLLGHQLKS
ncbi:MAG TPA: VWA domain-containing protein [Pseudohongiella sp.]|nr:VWA domain-containing protein [Pseudohongiella sp.]